MSAAPSFDQEIEAFCDRKRALVATIDAVLVVVEGVAAGDGVALDPAAIETAEVQIAEMTEARSGLVVSAAGLIQRFEAQMQATDVMRERMRSLTLRERLTAIFARRQARQQRDLRQHPQELSARLVPVEAAAARLEPELSDWRMACRTALDRNEAALAALVAIRRGRERAVAGAASPLALEDAREEAERAAAEREETAAAVEAQQAACELGMTAPGSAGQGIMLMAEKALERLPADDEAVGDLLRRAAEVSGALAEILAQAVSDGNVLINKLTLDGRRRALLQRGLSAPDDAARQRAQPLPDIDRRQEAIEAAFADLLADSRMRRKPRA
ncbi:hypothetical protein [Rhizobium halophytocola]|uniref:DUF222 domain-containing protein n=1 Tax=Rhizobium halophytocola TaxID=735519 RepID=A0ABS4E603_9HYPH|nr:hypothetical protein [Rhizobium halophytocola]MBP1853348.1 hypothetical protein [Rhizobium halophytocola]